MIPIIKEIKKLGITISKNFKRLLSSKISASIILFGPLIMILLIGLAFQSSGFFGVTVAVYSDNYNDVTNKIIDAMGENNFEVHKKMDKESCIEDVEQGINNMCITFPADFEKGKMEFYVDYSRLNLVYAIVSKLSTEIDELSSQISLSQTQDLLDFIEASGNNLNQSSMALNQLKNSAVFLKLRLSSISNNINHFGLEGAGLSDAEYLQIKQQLSTAKGDVDLLREVLINTSSDIEELDSDLTQQIQDTETAIESFSCTELNSRSLMNELDSNTFFQALLSTPNPTCSLLKTLKDVLEREQENIQTTTSNLDELIDYLAELKTQIGVMEQILDAKVKETESTLVTLQGAKENLSVEITSINEDTTATVQSLESLTAGLDAMLQTFNEVSLTDAEKVIKPIKTSIKSINTKKVNTLDILFPGILVMIIMFVGILLGNILVMKEKTTKAHFRSLIMPVNSSIFIIGTYLTTIIITLAQVLILLGVGYFLFSANIQLDTVQLALIIIPSTIIFTFLGMALGYFLKSEETAILASIILSLIFLMFSNLVIPIETMEASVGMIAKFTPFNIAEILLRRSLLFGAEVTGSNPLNYIVLLLEMIILLGIVVYAHRNRFEQNK